MTKRCLPETDSDRRATSDGLTTPRPPTDRPTDRPKEADRSSNIFVGPIALEALNDEPAALKLHRAGGFERGLET